MRERSETTAPAPLPPARSRSSRPQRHSRVMCRLSLCRHFRRLCLTALHSDLRAELRFIESVADKSPKNYQLWHHRRMVVADLRDASDEKRFCSKYIVADAKNYHAWSYRMWCVRAFELWEGELDAVDELLDDDVRNNSAWNHRWFVVTRGGARLAPTLDHALAAAEVEYALSALERATLNESAWSYLRAAVRASGEGSGEKRQWPQVLRRVQEWHANAAKDCRAGVNIFACEWLAEVAEEHMQAAASSGGSASASSSSSAAEGEGNTRGASAWAEAAIRLYAECEAVDTVRKHYWKYRQDTVSHKLAGLGGATTSVVAAEVASAAPGAVPLLRRSQPRTTEEDAQM